MANVIRFLLENFTLTLFVLGLVAVRDFAVAEASPDDVPRAH